MRHDPRILRISLSAAAALFMTMAVFVWIDARIHSSGPNVVGLIFWAACAIAIAVAGITLSVLLPPKPPRL